MARQRGFQRSTRRPVTWQVGPRDASGTIAATGKTLWTGSVAEAGGEASEATIVRTRGGGRIVLKSATLAGDGFEVGLGLAVFTDQAVAAGVASMPGPLTDADWDGWMWHAIHYVQVVTGTIADGVNAASASVGYEIDSKAMRKWDRGAETIAAVTEVTELGTGSIEHNAFTRMLVKHG